MASWFLSLLIASAVFGQSDCSIVYFGTSNCKPCQELQPALEQLAQERWDIRTVDANAKSELALLYKVQSLPTLVVVSDGREVGRIVGAVDINRLRERLTQIAATTGTGAVTALSTPATPRNTNLNTSQSQSLPSQAPTSQIGGFPMLSANDSSSVDANPGVAGSNQAGWMNNSTIDRSSPAVAASQSTSLDQTSNIPSFPQSNSSLASVTPASYSMAPASSTAKAESTPARTLTPEQAVARASQATVRIKVEESNTTAYGTGTIIDVHGREALVLTCGHLFRDMKPGSQLTIDLLAGTANQTNVIGQLIDFKAEDEDIGLVSFQLPFALEAVEVLPRGTSLPVGTAVFSFGCDHGADPTRRDTQIKSVNRFVGADNIEIVGAPVVGRSGGGLFDYQGRLVGVCNAANTADDEGIYAAADVVYTQIERLGMTHLFDRSNIQAQAAQAQLVPGANPVSPSVTTQPSGLASQSLDPAVGQWPDELVRNSTALSDSNSGRGDKPGMLQASPSFPATQSQGSRPTVAEQLICIVRDATGRSQVVTIDAPNADLVSTIQSYAK